MRNQLKFARHVMAPILSYYIVKALLNHFVLANVTFAVKKYTKLW